MTPARPLALAAALVVTLAACGAPPGTPALLPLPELAAAARQGQAEAPDNAALIARADRLSARAAALRRTSTDSHEAALARRRAGG